MLSLPYKIVSYKNLTDTYIVYTLYMAINYNIKGTGIAITDELRTYAERQLAHAEKFLQNDPTAKVDVELQYLEGGRSGKYRAEFTVSHEGGLARAEAWGSAMHEAIDIAGGELVHELRQSKDKRINVFRRSAVKVKEYLRGWRNKV